jgi:hypothetical protein
MQLPKTELFYKEQIPKIIHYCWFGGKPLPSLALKCLESWKFFLPDYKIVRWDENNFDINIIPYTQEAYKSKKYAFVSDYARFKILFDEGGIYLDTDVEILKEIDVFLDNEAFSGFEHIERVAPGLILGSIKNNYLFKEILESYNGCYFINSDDTFNLKTVVQRFTEILSKKGLKLNGEYQIISGLSIYPCEYFSPKSYESGEIKLTSNSFTIHHFAASWKPKYQKYEKYFWTLLGFKNQMVIDRVRNLFIKIIHLIRR